MTLDLPIPFEALLVELTGSHGMAIETEQVSEAFGNCFVDLSGDDIRLRFVRDRSQWFVLIGPACQPDKWFDVDLLRQLFGSEPAETLIPVEEQVDFIRENWPRLEEAFGTDQFSGTRFQLEQYGKARAARMFEGAHHQHREG